MRDDLGFAYSGARPRRVVSLVPSTTETVALAAPELLVGATDYCVQPPELDVPKVGGSKYPSVEKVLACRPDLVLANAEENRKSDVEALRAAGVAVWVCFPRTVPQALESARRMFTQALGLPEPQWIAEAAETWSTPAPPDRSAVVPIWRKPWMVLGGGTFAGDVLHRLGISNVYESAEDAYPKVTVEQIRQRKPDLVILPDEPYEFTAADGPEAFEGLPCALVSGRHLTWHGPSLVEARQLLADQLSHMV